MPDEAPEIHTSESADDTAMNESLTIAGRDDIVGPPRRPRRRPPRRGRVLAIVRGAAAVLAVLAIAVFGGRPGQEQAARTLVREPVPLPVPIATEPALRRDQVSPARGRPALPPPDITYTYSVSSAGQVTSDVEEFAAHAAVTLNDPRGWALD